MRCGRFITLLLAILPAAAAAESANPPAQSAAENAGPGSPPQTTAATPHSQPAVHLKPFQRGVTIDWQRPAVHVQSHVVLREGVLEFLACFAGKTHESILRFDASAMHIYLALGLIGLQPGHPPRWDTQRDRLIDPTGDLIDIELRWQADGVQQRANAAAWLHALEYGRSPLPRPWIFSGSLRRPDGGLSSDETGVGVALVDFPDSLISYSRRFPSSYAHLWVVPNTPAVPPLDTPVTVVFTPAASRDRHVWLDGRGVAWVDGQFAAWGDLADLLRLERRLDAAHVQDFVVGRSLLAADRRRLIAFLRASNVPPKAVRWVEAAEPEVAAPQEGNQRLPG